MAAFDTWNNNRVEFAKAPAHSSYDYAGQDYPGLSCLMPRQESSVANRGDLGVAFTFLYKPRECGRGDDSRQDRARVETADARTGSRMK
jgi:hypothetical protein